MWLWYPEPLWNVVIRIISWRPQHMCGPRLFRWGWAGQHRHSGSPSCRSVSSKTQGLQWSDKLQEGIKGSQISVLENRYETHPKHLLRLSTSGSNPKTQRSRYLGMKQRAGASESSQITTSYRGRWRNLPRAAGQGTVLAVETELKRGMQGQIRTSK